LGIYQQIKTIEGGRTWTTHSCITGGNERNRKTNGRENEWRGRGGTGVRKTAEEAFLQPIITYEG
jgi:hypothetical protein